MTAEQQKLVLGVPPTESRALLRRSTASSAPPDASEKAECSTLRNRYLAILNFPHQYLHVIVHKGR